MRRVIVATLACAAAALGACREPPTASQSVPHDPRGASATSEYSLALHGGAVVTEFAAPSRIGGAPTTVTTILASEGELTDASGGCCRISGDTLLQMNLRGTLSVGSRQIDPPVITVEDRLNAHTGLEEPIVLRYGADDVVLLIYIGERWPTNFTRMLIQSRPAVLTISEYIAPDRERTNGFLRGSIVFQAAEYTRERLADGTVRISKFDAPVRVSATFSQPVRHRIQ